MMPIQRQSDSFGAFNEGTRWARDRAQTELPKGLAALINTSGPRITGGMLNTREAGMHYPDEYDPRVDGWPEEDLDRPSASDLAEWDDDERRRRREEDEHEDYLRSVMREGPSSHEARRRAPRRPFDREASYDDAATTGTCRWCGDDVRYMPVKPGDPTQGYDYQHEDHPYLDYGHPAEPEGEHYEDGPSWYDEDDPQEWRQASLEDWAGGNENPDRHRIPKRPKDEPGFDPRRDSDFDDDPDPLMGWESLGVDGPRPRGWSQHYYADKKCDCWDGYERVPGTKPCAEGSCRKCDSHRKSSRLASGDRLDDLTQRKALNLVKGWMSRYLGHDEDDVPSGDRAYQSGAGLKLHPAYERTWQDPFTGQLNTHEPVPAILHEGYSGWADDASFDDDLRERLNGIGVEPGNWNGSVLTLHPYEEWEIPEHIRRQSRLAGWNEDNTLSYEDVMKRIDEQLAAGQDGRGGGSEYDRDHDYEDPYANYDSTVDEFSYEAPGRPHVHPDQDWTQTPDYNTGYVTEQHHKVQNGRHALVEKDENRGAWTWQHFEGDPFGDDLYPNAWGVVPTREQAFQAGDEALAHTNPVGHMWSDMRHHGWDPMDQGDPMTYRGEPEFANVRHPNYERYMRERGLEPRTDHLAALPMQPPVVGAHGFQPAHRVGLAWRDQVIPGTVIGLDGPNVAVRWDDGQYSTEEPHNINLL